MFFPVFAWGWIIAMPRICTILAISRRFFSFFPWPWCGCSSSSFLTSLAAAVWEELCLPRDCFSSHWLLFA